MDIHPRWKGFVLAGTALLLLNPLFANDPAWRNRVTTTPPGSFPMLESCHLTYRLSWNGILKAGETDISFYGDGSHPKGRGMIYTSATMKSAGLARAMWPYDGLNESWVDRRSLKPVRVFQHEEDRQEKNTYRTEFQGPLVTNQWITIPQDDAEAKETRNRAYHQEPHMMDLVSAMLYLRSLPPRTSGSPFSIICYPFRDPYLITVKPMGRENHSIVGRSVPAHRYSISFQKIQGDQTLKSYDDKLKSASFWISDDELRLPLELRAEIFVGSIMVTLKKYEKIGGAAEKKFAGLRRQALPVSSAPTATATTAAVGEEKERRRFFRKRKDEKAAAADQ